MTDFAADRLTLIKDAGLYRTLQRLSARSGAIIEIEAREFINFGSNDYLGLTQDSATCIAAIDAIKQWGFGAGSARLISGSLDPHHQLEEAISRHTGAEAAILFNSGYHANVGGIAALAEEGDLIFSDQLCHASIVDGCRLSKAKRFVFSHSDMLELEALLKREHCVGQRWVVTEGLFSMDGDIAPLAEISDLCRRYDALLMVDEAHSFGVLGDVGLGAWNYAGLRGLPDVYTATFSKSPGGFGAFMAVSSVIKELLINRARSFIFSTALPPSVAAGDMAALDIIFSERGAQLRTRLHKLAMLFRDGLRNLGYAVENTASPIVPLVIGDSCKALQAAEKMQSEGIFVRAVRYPTVPEGTARLRFSLRADMEDEHITRCLVAAAGLNNLKLR